MTISRASSSRAARAPSAGRSSGRAWWEPVSRPRNADSASATSIPVPTKAPAHTARGPVIGRWAQARGAENRGRHLVGGGHGSLAVGDPRRSGGLGDRAVDPAHHAAQLAAGLLDRVRGALLAPLGEVGPAGVVLGDPLPGEL